MQRHTTIKQEDFFSGDQVVGRQEPAHHQEYCSKICRDRVQCLAYLYDFGCGLILVADLIASRLNFS